MDADQLRDLARRAATRWLEGNGLVVIEVDRADRKARRFHGKSDVQDAINAARMVQSRIAQVCGRALGRMAGLAGRAKMYK